MKQSSPVEADTRWSSL